MSEGRYILAIDQGTTSTRSILFDHRAKIVATAQAEFPQHYPRDGWVEHDPEDIWQGVLATAREAMAGVDPAQVAAIGIANQRETTLLWDRDTGAPLFPVEERPMPLAVLPGERTAATQHFPVLPPPFTRQQLTRADLTTRTPAAHAAALKLFDEYGTRHPYDPPNLRGTIIYPGVDGGGRPQ